MARASVGAAAGRWLGVLASIGAPGPAAGAAWPMAACWVVGVSVRPPAVGLAGCAASPIPAAPEPPACLSTPARRSPVGRA